VVEERTSVAVFGLPGFRLLEVTEVDGELEYVIETMPTPVGCTTCGSVARAKGRRESVLRDLPQGEWPVRLRWRKRVWSCPDPDCPRKTWTEDSWLAAARAQLTERARAEICRRVGEDNASVALCARHFGVGWHTAWKAVVDVGTPKVEDPSRLAETTAVGLDETMYLHARRGRRRVLVTGVVDVDTGVLLDVFVGRDAADLRRWMAGMPRDWLAQIQVVSVDPHEGYRSAVHGADPATALPSPWAHTTIVVDPFHVVRLANQAVTKCRQRVQQDVLGHRGWKDDPLYGIRRLLLVAQERLTEPGWTRLRAGLNRGDRLDQVLDCWLAKEKVRDVYLTDDPELAAQRLDDAISFTAESRVPEVKTLGKSLKRWRTAILAHHTTGASNGPTEAVNLTIKAVKRCGRGFRNFANYRLRLLLVAGVRWQTQPVTRLRARPRFIA
jgi:transposase